MKCRDVAIADIPNTFVQTDLMANDKAMEIITVNRGQLADLLVEVAPDVYAPAVTKDKKGNTVIYVYLLKALYGIMEVVLMFYQKLFKFLKNKKNKKNKKKKKKKKNKKKNKKGSKPNPHDMCIVNKKINGSQFTITFHVDDLKLGHNDPQEVIKMIDHLMSLYEKQPNVEIKKMNVQRMDERKSDHFGYSTKVR